MVGERLVGDKKEGGLPVGAPRGERPTPMPTARPRLGVLTRKHPTLTKVERPQHGIPRLEHPTLTVTVVGHLDGMRAHEHRMPTPKEGALRVGTQAREPPTRMPAQVRTRTLLAQVQVGVSLRVVQLRAGSNHREILTTMLGVTQQPRRSG